MKLQTLHLKKVPVRTMLSLFFVLLIVNSSTGLRAQFPVESAEVAWELRMKGDIHYANAMLRKLASLKKFENGMVDYELSRLMAHQSMGGAEWITQDAIIKQVKWAIEKDPENLLFTFAEANYRFGKAYMSVMTNGETAAEDVKAAVSGLEEVLKMDPDFHEVRVQLVEMYAQLPEEMSGNPQKAEEYASLLEEKDPWFGMLARDVMLPDSLSRVDYWKKLVKKNEKDVRVKVKLGMAYLLEGSIEEGGLLLEEAMKEDPKYNLMLLHLARYHIYGVMRDRSQAAAELPLAEDYLRRYLDSEPEPINPMKAWALGHLSMFKRITGDHEAAEKLLIEARTLDPSYSRATGLPGMDLYVSPGEVYRSGDYRSFLRPF